MAGPPHPVTHQDRTMIVPGLVPRTLDGAANLANLLPTGTVLAFQVLAPSFSNNGSCCSSNIYLTGVLIITCALACFLSSFTDSFTGPGGKLYYGIATPRGLYVFNWEEEGREVENRLAEYRVRFIDFVHAILSLLVFLVFALSEPNVAHCFFPKVGPEKDALVVNLPLGMGVLVGFLFMIFPTTRRGIGYADAASHA